MACTAIINPFSRRRNPHNEVFSMEHRIGGEAEAHSDANRAASLSDKEVENTSVTPTGPYERFLELTGDGVLFMQKETIRELNRAMANMCGYSIKDLIGRPLSLLSENGSTDLSQLAATIDNSNTATIKDHPSMLRRHDGSAFPVKINASRVDYKSFRSLFFW